VVSVNNPNSMPIVSNKKSRKYDNIDQKSGTGCPVTCKGGAGGVTGTAVHRSSVGGRMWWVTGATPPSLYPGERDPVPTVQGLGTGLDGSEKSHLQEVRGLERVAVPATISRPPV